MISYQIYKLLHFFGIFSTLIAVAAVCLHVVRGGARADNPMRGPLSALHGVGLLFVLVGGFGMLARIDRSPAEGWAIAKLVIWLLLGAAMTLAYRRPASARMLLLLLPVFGVLAAWLALYKPF